MIPALVILLLKYIGKHNSNFQAFKINTGTSIYLTRYMIMILILLIICITSLVLKGQQLNYTVWHNGNNIGWVKLDKSCNTEQLCKMVLSSETKFRMILPFTNYIMETAYFLKEKLVFSSQFHKSNSTVKVKKHTKYTGNGYEVSDGGKTINLGNEIIQFNLLCLYFQEPYTLQKVYCDKQQSYADIERTPDGGYSITFKNGNSNCFYYNNGICTKVKIKHQLYSSMITLNR